MIKVLKFFLVTPVKKMFAKNVLKIIHFIKQPSVVTKSKTVECEQKSNKCNK